jgi:hypothetical protein
LKIILHVGMPKAGSSALQLACARSRRDLARRGVLYPKSPISARHHNLLAAGLRMPGGRLPRRIAAAHGDRLLAGPDSVADWIASAKAEAGAVWAETLVLSSESLFRLSGEDSFRRLESLLRGPSDSLEIVAYVRRPSEHYLSSVQQILKASHRIRPLRPVRYRTALEGFARIADRLHVIKYDRSAFPDGDIFGDFLRLVPGAGGLAAPRGEGDTNVSISAEGMALLFDYRRLVHSQSRNRFTPDSERLLRAIRAAERRVGGEAAPRLIEAIREAVDLASEDILWLRDRHGIVFDGVDYGRVGTALLTTRPERIESICVVDPDRREALLMRTVQALANGEGEKPRRQRGFARLRATLAQRLANRLRRVGLSRMPEHKA